MRRVLIADDEPQICLLLMRTLKHLYRLEDEEIVPSKNPPELVDNIKRYLGLEYGIDLIVSDVHMGYQHQRAHQELAELYDVGVGREIPVIFLTGDSVQEVRPGVSLREDILAKFQDGKVECIDKPYELRYLNERVKALTGWN